MPSKLFYLIDDDPDEQYVFEVALGDVDRTAKLLWRPDGSAAIDELRDHSVTPDYIFIDINMPRISGWECLERIRAIRHLQETPIAMYSTSATKSLQKQGDMASLASACIDKKSSIPELAKVLRNFMEKHS